MVPSTLDLVGTGDLTGWTAPFLLGSGAVNLRDGMPLLARYPAIRLPGWGSYSEVRLISPLRAGVWGGGSWALDFASRAVPDSSFRSTVALVQSTAGRNRFAAALARPAPLGLSLDLAASRDDSLLDQRVAVGLGELGFEGTAWQGGDDDSYVLSAGWEPGPVRTRLSFGHLRDGGRLYSLLADWHGSAGGVGLAAGAAGTLEDDSVQAAEAHLLAGLPLGGGAELLLRGDARLGEGVPAHDAGSGGTAGLFGTLGPLDLQVGAAYYEGHGASAMAGCGLGPAMCWVSLDGDGAAGAVQTDLETGILTAQACAAFTGDTLRFSGRSLAGLPWGAAGRISAGPSWSATLADGEPAGTMDARSLFTLGTFGFIFAVEDVLDDFRSYSFGAVWSFSDLPPEPAEEGER